MRDTKRSELISTQLRQIAEQAIEHPDRVFTTLIHRMDVDFLREAYPSFFIKAHCAVVPVPTNNLIRSQCLETDPRNVEISKKGESENRA